MKSISVVPVASTRVGGTTTVSAVSTNERSVSVPVVPNSYIGPSPSCYKPGKVDIFFLGMSTVLAGHYMSWNLGLLGGLYTFLIVYVIVALAYVTFCCCVAEITSALPFAGGSYGIARCTLGFFPAYLIGCAEALEYIASVAIVTIYMTDIIAASLPSLDHYKPLVWLVFFYLPTTMLRCIGGAPFWIVSTSLGLFSTVVLVVYCFGMLGHGNFQINTLSDPEMLFAGGFDMAMLVYPFATCFFLGVETLTLASNDVAMPRTQVPHGQIGCAVGLMTMGLFTSLVTVALPTDGGVAGVATALAPLDNGFINVFHIDPYYVTILTLIPQYAAAYGFSWASSKLLSSMGRSHLLPPWLGTTSARLGTPHWAIVVSSVLGYGTCLLVHYYPTAIGYILPMCLLFAFMSYSGQCIGYILLTIRFPITAQCAFKNPFGIAGAVYSLCVWLFGIFAIIGYQGHKGIEVIFLAIAVFVLGVYYQLIAKKRQTMSEEESKVLLVVHIRVSNKRKKGGRTQKSTHRSAVARVRPSIRPTTTSGAPGRASGTQTS
jgi:ethanolamine permease